METIRSNNVRGVEVDTTDEVAKLFNNVYDLLRAQQQEIVELRQRFDPPVETKPPVSSAPPVSPPTPPEETTPKITRRRTFKKESKQ